MRGFSLLFGTIKCQKNKQKIVVTIYSLKCNSVPMIQATSTAGIPSHILFSSYLFLDCKRIETL